MVKKDDDDFPANRIYSDKREENLSGSVAHGNDIFPDYGIGTTIATNEREETAGLPKPKLLFGRRNSVSQRQ